MRPSAIMEVSLLPGTGIEDAVKETRALARSLNVAYIRFNFNGTRFSIGQNAVLEYVLDQYADNKTEHIISAN